MHQESKILVKQKNSWHDKSSTYAPHKILSTNSKRVWLALSAKVLFLNSLLFKGVGENSLKNPTHCIIVDPKIIGRSFVAKLLCEYTKGNSIGSLFSSPTAFVRSRVGLESSVLYIRKFGKIGLCQGVKECA